MLESVGVWAPSARWHAAHQGCRIYLSSGPRHGHVHLLWHTSWGAALLARVVRHSGSHRMPRHSRVLRHARRMARERRSHTCHHVFVWSTIHDVDIDDAPYALSHALAASHALDPTRCCMVSPRPPVYTRSRGRHTASRAVGGIVGAGVSVGKLERCRRVKYLT